MSIQKKPSVNKTTASLASVPCNPTVYNTLNEAEQRLCALHSIVANIRSDLTGESQTMQDDGEPKSGVQSSASRILCGLNKLETDLQEIRSKIS